jgi:fumarate reductase subunit C
MTSDTTVIAGAGLSERTKKSHWPARLDVLQSVSGLFLGLFMWGHMMFVSSILISRDAMWTVTKMFEGYFVFGTGYPVMVSGVVAFVFFTFIAHAFLAMRKFPANYEQYKTFIGHKNLFRHADTSLWWLQFVTGFLLFFLGSAHLYQMLMNPGAIGPFASGARVFQSWWPLYLVLLFCVELHGGVGLYRLAVKWGWFEGKDPEVSRKRLSRFKWGLTAFFLVLGLLTLAAYYRIGLEIRDNPGARYTPAWATEGGTGGGR